jgi:hypothetical protein
MAGLFDPLNPLQGLQNIPGANQLTGADNFITSGQVTGFAGQAIPSLIRGDNPFLSIGLGGLGAIQGGQTAATNLANIAKTRQDLVKGGLDITKTGLEIKDKDYDLSLKKHTRAKLLQTIYNMSPQEQALAESNPQAFTAMLVDRYKPTADMTEYNFAKTQGYQGDLEDWIKDVTKFKATTINMGQEGAYNKKLGDLLAEQDVAFVQSSYDLPIQMRKLDTTLNVVRNPNIQPGKFARFETGFKSAAQKWIGFGSSVDSSVESMQLLDSLLGSDVFPMIKTLGIGARGLDTPAEREFLQKVMTGDIELNRSTLTKMTMIRRRQVQEMMKRYNDRLSRGDLDQYQKGSGRTLEALDLGNSYNSPVITTGTQKSTGKKFNVYSDGKAYFTKPDGTLDVNDKGEPQEVIGFDWLKYTYE